ncbi:Uncharacterised protein [Candidatus Gugararchaeum adminiculabundum]|nr:Uncharacterised protein [Candidatus Gugararchaeum adminiculabundum]
MVKNLDEKIGEEFGGFPAHLINAMPAAVIYYSGSARLQGGFPKPPAPLERRPAILPEPLPRQKAFKNAIIKRRITVFLTGLF